MTTGELQQRVYLGGERFPGRAVVVGAEHVSCSAMLTLAHAGARVVALVTDQPASQSYAVFSLAASLRWHVPVWTSTAVRRVGGRERLAGVELAAAGRGPDGSGAGAGRFVPCDTLVFTGDWVPDHELARRGGAGLDPGTPGPAVDTALETSVPLVFAAGNLVHAAETADVAALGGRHAARHIAAPPPRGRFLLRTAGFRPPGRFEIRQDGPLLAAARHGRLVPGRAIHLAAPWAARTDPAAGPVRIALA